MSENPLLTGARVGNFPLEMAKIATDWLLQTQGLAACSVSWATLTAGMTGSVLSSRWHSEVPCESSSGSPLALEVEAVSPLLWVDRCDVAECGQHGV